MPPLASTAFITLVVSSLVILNLTLAGIWLYVPYGPYIVIAHFIWGLFIDTAPVNGEGRIFNFLRHNWLWHFAQAYFSHKLRQEAPLNPEDKHLFVAHPHGIIALSSWLVFGGDSIQFQRNNPKLQVSIVTVGLNFMFPLWRDLLLSLGFLDASYASLRAVFKRGRSAVLMVGGSQEALESHPNTNRIVLDKRKGFIKLALVSGVKVVPVYTFGETNMFTQVANPRGSWLRSCQEALVGYLTISTPLLTSGPLPKSTPLLTVIGEAIDFPHLENPSSEDIEKYHGIYKTALQKLFDKHKRDFYSDLELQTADLQIIA